MNNDIFVAATAGIAGLDLPAPIKASVGKHLQAWLADPANEGDVPQIRSMVDRGLFDELADGFYRVLPFGTGGRRGRVGLGPNRLNGPAVQASVQGHIAWLRSRFDGDVSVVIAYDVRAFQDARGVLDDDLPCSVMGLSSRGLAEQAACVYAANGVQAHLLPAGVDRYMSTPELSFAIRQLKAQGGLNLSASHNPPDDNGVKVYDHHGAQLIPPDDEQLLTAVAAVTGVKTMDLQRALDQGLVVPLAASMHEAYVRTIAELAPHAPRSIKVRYTPLHGTGVIHKVLRAAGFDCECFAPQAQADGSFPTVPGGVANPENEQAMALALADNPDVALVFGTDPDADRIGCEVRHNGQFVHLTGNDIAVLVVDAALNGVPAGKRGLIVRTEVTSSLVSVIAKARGAAVVDDLLVGFKYIGEVLRAMEEEGRFGDLAADGLSFCAGVEESHGVLVSDVMRDKDAAGGAVWLAVRADALAREGRTLVDRLHQLQAEHGFYQNGQLSVRFEGATGADKMAAVLQQWRSAAPASIAGRQVTSFTDHQREDGHFGSFKSGSDKASRNVLVYHLGAGEQDMGARVILRPSGTEPKLKIYVEMQGKAGLDDAGRQGVKDAYDQLVMAVKAMLAA